MVMVLLAAGCRAPRQVDSMPFVSQEFAAGEDFATRQVGYELPVIPPIPPQLPQLNNSTPLKLAEAEQIALQKNPSLAVRQSQLDVSEGRWEQAGLYPNPIIGYHATEVGNLDTSGVQGLFVRQRVITGGKRRLDQQVADSGIDLAEFQMAITRQRVITEVRLRFFDLLVARRRVELTTKLAELTNQLAGTTKKLLDGNIVSDNDLLQAEIEAEQAQILRDNAQQATREFERRLSAVIGIRLPPDHPIQGQLSQDSPQLTWKTSLQGTLSGSPELQAAAVRVERARRAIERANQQPIPDIDFLLSLRHNNITGHDVANIQVGIPVPVFDRNQGNIRAAIGEMAAAQNDERRIQLRLEQRLAVAFRRYQNALHQVRRYKKFILPKAEQSMTLVRKAYSGGQANYLMLITSQRTFIRASLSHLDSLRALREAGTMIEGRLLTDSLDEPGRGR